MGFGNNGLGEIINKQNQNKAIKDLMTKKEFYSEKYNIMIKNPYLSENNPNPFLTKHEYFPIIINGQVEVVPMSELKEIGWHYQDSPNENITIGYLGLTSFKQDGNIVFISNSSPLYGIIKKVNPKKHVNLDNKITQYAGLKDIHDSFGGIDNRFELQKK